MTIQDVIIGFFVIVICICVFKKQYAGAGLTLLIGFVVIALLNDKDYWNMGGKSLLNLAISIISGFKFKQ